MWDERYAAQGRVWSAEPNAEVERILGDWEPGRALDLGAGEGRHAVWLAEKRWRVTAVDFSAVGLAKGEKDELLDAVNGALAELRDNGEYQKIYDQYFTAN